MAYVQVAPFEGFSLSKLGKWVGGTASAIAKGDTAAIVAQATAAIPGAKAKPVVGPVLPKQEPGVFSPGGFVEKNQTTLLLVAAGLAAFLVLGRRKGRK